MTLNNKTKINIMYSRLLMIFVFGIFDAEPNQKSLLIKEEMNQSLTECLLNVIQKLTKNAPKILLLTSKQYTKTVTDLLSKIEIPAIINVAEHRKPTFEIDKRTPTTIAVIFDEDAKFFDILNGTLWLAETRFLLIYKQKINMEDIFRQFWRLKVVNVFVFVTQGSDAVVYSFVPFQEKDCSSVKPKVIDKWISGRFIRNLTEITKSPRIQNFNGCDVNVSVVDVKPQVMFQDECNCNGTWHLDGIEARIMNEIAKKLNFKAMYLTSIDGVGWGWLNPKPAGVVGEVYTGRSLFGFGLLATTLDRYSGLDFSAPYSASECCTYGVPRGAVPRPPQWLELLTLEFPPLMWGLIGIAFLSVLLNFWFVNTSLNHKTVNNIITYAFATCLGVPVKHPATAVLRITFISWVWFTYIITVAYQSSMGSKLTVPSTDRDINTFKELLDSDLTITGFYNVKKLIEDNEQTEELIEQVKRFVVTTYGMEDALQLIVRNRNIAHARPATTLLYHSLIMPEAKGKIHLIKDCYYVYFPTFVTKKYSPFTNSISKIITRLREAGLTNYWRSLFVYEVPPTPEDFTKLSVNHLFGIFFVYSLGTFLSTAVFITELIYCYCISVRSRLRFKCKSLHKNKKVIIPFLK